jgi:hypothetical protein
MAQVAIGLVAASIEVPQQVGEIGGRMCGRQWRSRQ